MPSKRRKQPHRSATLPSGEPVRFLIAGAQKSGTTALADYLRLHAGVFIPGTKEVHFFDRDSHFVSNVPDYRRYHEAFVGLRPDQVAGEATPRYLYWRNCAQRIHAYNPHMRLIFVLRNPIDRAYSHWHMQKRRGRELLSFSEAIRAEPQRLDEAGSARSRGWYAYLERGMYSRQIRDYLDVFPRENLLFLRSEQLMSDHADALTRICGFLDLPDFDPVPDAHVSFAQEYEPMDEQDRRYLREYFRASIEELERLLEWDCATWLS